MSQVSSSLVNSPAGDLASRFAAVRSFTATLCETLEPEDCCLQSMPSASPVRWHLAHTSWFFETFLLKSDAGYRPFDEHYEVLFNSYYNSVGEQFPRAQRGLLSRPTVAEVFAYRRRVDEEVMRRLERGAADDPAIANVVEWGLQHEQQHQELILTDVKHLFSINPLLPTYRPARRVTAEAGAPVEWLEFDEGLYETGHDGEGFSYDNELPRHREFLAAFRLASRPVTSGEFLEFIDDGGYRRPELWLSDGWRTVNDERWTAPLYWRERDGQWREFTLAGERPIDLDAPACHASFYEADAYARWAGARLPTEAEWEAASQHVDVAGHFVDVLLADARAIHPSGSGVFCDLHASTSLGSLQSQKTPDPIQAPALPRGPAQMFGDVWEWTASPYLAYPGYRPPSGALGEYNGKFMCNQFVLRGGSCATHSTHIRRTYRNFFTPESRWQFAGFRLAT
jgi:ergothioneine biosynthesis protein EgtB